MRLATLTVQNYKGLQDVHLPMSRFGCLIGENNSGKSSVLQTLSLFSSGSSLPATHYYNATRPIRIELGLTDISGADLMALVDEHRQRIAEIVEDGKLTLVRIYGVDGKSKLKYRAMVPTDQRFSPDSVQPLLKNQRAGNAFVQRVVETFPELSGSVDSNMNQGEMRTAIEALARSLPNERKTLIDADLPTGIEASIKAMLPEIIYIPAVKDLADDIKTKEGTPFAKVLAVLLRAIEPKLADMKELFARLDGQLNRVTLSDGTIQDNRLDEVRLIERTVEKFVQESFSAVTLKINIPPPELKTILSSAQILANDGVEGPIETKGDGLRRAVVFAVLRSYVELMRSGLTAESPANADLGRYLLLFEEPELYLHPKAQEILFDALRIFSERHHVVVTTHSPMFFGPSATATFTKLTKKVDPAVGPTPFVCAHPVDLTEMNAKDQFQIICYENNNIAFFADTVVLVEGDSDYLVLPHLACVIDSRWDCARTAIRFAKINGKSSIRRYRQFFSRFDSRLLTISDLDLVLRGFDQVDPTPQMEQTRQQLLRLLDAAIASSGSTSSPTVDEVRKAQEKRDVRAVWTKACEVQERFAAGNATFDDVRSAVADFYAWQRSDERLAILQAPTDKAISDLKAKLLSQLRAQGVFVLEKGDIEAYYPKTVTGADKPRGLNASVTQSQPVRLHWHCVRRLMSMRTGQGTRNSR